MNVGITWKTVVAIAICGVLAIVVIIWVVPPLIAGQAENIFNGFANWLGDAAGYWGNAFNTWSNDVGTSVSDGVNGIVETTGEIFDNVGTTISDGIDGVVQTTGDIFANVGTILSDGWSNFLQTLGLA